jgi:2'-5' RNA ligase
MKMKINFLADPYDAAIVKQYQKNFLEFFNAEVSPQQVVTIALYEFAKNRGWKIETDGDRVTVTTDNRTSV